DLVGRQHQGRQVKALLENITHARLATDRHALLHERCDIAIDRAFRRLQLGRDGVSGQRFAGAPEHLNDLEKTIGTSHERSQSFSNGAAGAVDLIFASVLPRILQANVKSETALEPVAMGYE